MSEEWTPARISPTAHYTSYVWVRHGFSPRAFATPTGKAMYWSMVWFHWLSRLATRGGSLEQALVQRHVMIDHYLAAAIEDGRVGQVVEVAAGLTGRGVRFMERYRGRGLVYVEADLPQMAAHKRGLLDGAGLMGAGHHVVAADALEDAGPDSLWGAVGPLLDPGKGVALITEGLLAYYPREDICGMWARFARFLGGYPRGVHLADLRLAEEIENLALVRAFRLWLQHYTGGQAGMAFQDLADATAALKGAGFDPVALHHPNEARGIPGLEPVPGRISARCVEAWVRR